MTHSYIYSRFCWRNFEVNQSVSRPALKTWHPYVGRKGGLFKWLHTLLPDTLWRGYLLGQMEIVCVFLFGKDGMMVRLFVSWRGSLKIAWTDIVILAHRTICLYTSWNSELHDRMSKIYNPELFSCLLTDNKLQSANEYFPFHVIARFVNDLKDVKTFYLSGCQQLQTCRIPSNTDRCRYVSCSALSDFCRTHSWESSNQTLWFVSMTRCSKEYPMQTLSAAFGHLLGMHRNTPWMYERRISHDHQ